MGSFWRAVTSDSQLRWIGPDKGAIHLATAAVVNAVWDLWAKTEHKPVWKLLVDMSPETLVRCLDFRYVTDALTPQEALAILRRHEPTKAGRVQEMLAQGYPAYTTSAGWLGYDDEKILAASLAKGWPRDGRTSSRKSAAIPTRTCGARAFCATKSALIAS